jgi:hypothetical protein
MGGIVSESQLPAFESNGSNPSRAVNRGFLSNAFMTANRILQGRLHHTLSKVIAARESACHKTRRNKKGLHECSPFKFSIEYSYTIP